METQYGEQTAIGYTMIDVTVGVEEGRLSRNNYCHREAIIITHSQCEILALVI
jgi:hypothetical protein